MSLWLSPSHSLFFPASSQLLVSQTIRYLLNKSRSLNLPSSWKGSCILSLALSKTLNLLIKALDGKRQSKVQYAGSPFTGLNLLFGLWHDGKIPSSAPLYRHTIGLLTDVVRVSCRWWTRSIVPELNGDRPVYVLELLDGSWSLITDSTSSCLYLKKEASAEVL